MQNRGEVLDGRADARVGASEGKELTAEFAENSEAGQSYEALTRISPEIGMNFDAAAAVAHAGAQ